MTPEVVSGKSDAVVTALVTTPEVFKVPEGDIDVTAVTIVPVSTTVPACAVPVTAKLVSAAARTATSAASGSDPVSTSVLNSPSTYRHPMPLTASEASGLLSLV